MTAHEEISAWLNSTEQDFQQGNNLLDKYSRNRCIKNFVSRKKNIGLLKHHLEKLLAMPEKFLLPKTATQAAPIQVKKVILDPAERQQVKFEKINPETLPAELQAIYNQVAEAYKMQRVYHEKMKLATTDEQRGELRAKDIEYDDIIAEGWNKIDMSLLAQRSNPNPAQQPEPKDKTVIEISKEINACRSYISNGLKALDSLDEKKRAKRVDEIKKRVTNLIRHKATVAPETKIALISAGIIPAESKLLVEQPRA